MTQHRDLIPVSVYLFRDQRQKLQDEADERGLSLSSHIRSLLLDAARKKK